jgi:(p)ppGpp synthase/HD superfamily hydrolase
MGQSPWSQDRYSEAYRFAAEAHNGQQLPGTHLPYIAHPTLVCMEIMAVLALEEGLDGDLAVQSALLHDTLEDTPVSFDDLKVRFGIKVAQGVLALTLDPSIASKADRVRDSLKRIQQQPREIWIVKMADRITNLNPPPANWRQAKIDRYRQESHMIYAALKDASRFLAQRLKHKTEAYTYRAGS